MMSSSTTPCRGPICALLCVLLCSLTACRQEIPWTPVGTQVCDPIITGPQGLFLLCEGNMGSNKASLDFLDFRTGVYTTHVYQGNTQGLGDVGNDLQLYHDRLYAVINCSNLVEVLDPHTAQHLGQVAIPNCRNICFYDNYAYVTSYVGPVDPSKSQLGCVAKVDLTTLQVVDTCRVGYQPNGIGVCHGKLYVANSGGYQNPGYDDRLSVIDIPTFRLERHIPVVINMDRLIVDPHDNIWVTTPGDYYDLPSSLYQVTPDGQVTDMHIPATSLWLQTDTLYVLANTFNYVTFQQHTALYRLHPTQSTISNQQSTIDTLTLDDPTLTNPYAIAVHPTEPYLYIADARDYVNPGALHCYHLPQSTISNMQYTISNTRPLLTPHFTIRTGDIPAHFAFLP